MTGTEAFTYFLGRLALRKVEMDLCAYHARDVTVIVTQEVATEALRRACQRYTSILLEHPDAVTDALCVLELRLFLAEMREMVEQHTKSIASKNVLVETRKRLEHQQRICYLVIEAIQSALKLSYHSFT